MNVGHPSPKPSIQTNCFPFMSLQVFHGGFVEFFASPPSDLAGRILLSPFSLHLAETQGKQVISKLVTVQRTDLAAFNATI